METNVRRYAAYQAARNLLAWLPVFVLYLSQHVPIADVLALESIYYATVVALEVPSGYASDRWGRRPTLLIANLAWVAAGIVFYLSSTFVAFAVAQALLAVGMAFNSGTDGSLLYDSLQATGRADAFAEHEGRGQAWGRISLGVAALLGGVIGAWNLGAVYLVSAAAAAVATAIAWTFVEPPRLERPGSVRTQIAGVWASRRDPWLRWMFAYAVAMTVFDHIPYELAQPYLDVVLTEQGRAGWTEPAAGLLTAVAMLLSAFVAGRAGRWVQWGVARSLLLAMAIEGLLIVALGSLVHPVVAGLLVLRSVPGAIHGPVVQSVVHPRITSTLRATYLSVQSLAGRLAFSASLLLASSAIGGPLTDSLLTIARAFAIAVMVTWVGLALTSRRLS